MTTKPIVVGTDGSTESLRAVEWAAREAKLHQAPLRIVSAAELLPRMAAPGSAYNVEAVASTIRASQDDALAVAARAAHAMAHDLLIDTDTLEGPPAIAVTEASAGAHLLVVGSRGSGAFSAMLLGSVSRYAAVHASCPVVVVREETMATHRQVIVGIRDPHDCAAAVEFAFTEAALRKASLLAVHAWQSPRAPVEPYPAWDNRFPEAEAVMQLEELLRDWREKYPEVAASQDAVHGHPGRVLAGLSARADLVVLGRHHRAGHHVPGPARIVHAVLSHAHGPIAIVPSD
ncbi:MAG TPA: universal stress protein [Streptosporangiaceae bacterium]|nr:universal stress protein [Streptosporangiaceae bacterium]